MVPAGRVSLRGWTIFFMVVTQGKTCGESILASCVGALFRDNGGSFAGSFVPISMLAALPPKTPMEYRAFDFCCCSFCCFAKASPGKLILPLSFFSFRRLAVNLRILLTSPPKLLRSWGMPEPRCFLPDRKEGDGHKLFWLRRHRKDRTLEARTRSSKNL